MTQEVNIDLTYVINFSPAIHAQPPLIQILVLLITDALTTLFSTKSAENIAFSVDSTPRPLHSRRHALPQLARSTGSRASSSAKITSEGATATEPIGFAHSGPAKFL
jgi:hypothetical protein